MKDYSAVDKACKEIFDIAYKQGYEDGLKEKPSLIYKHYENGLNNAWECARKIAFCNQGELCEIFPEDDFDDNDLGWLDKYTASEAMEKVREYEERRTKIGCQSCNDWNKHDGTQHCISCNNYSAYERKNLDEEIEVGDEVQGNYTNKLYVVTDLEYNGDSSLLGCMYGERVQRNKVHKTGRHFTNIAQCLKELREGEERGHTTN